MYERIQREYLIDVLSIADIGDRNQLCQLGDMELFDFVYENCSHGGLQVVWQNYVLRYSPIKTANEIC